MDSPKVMPFRFSQRANARPFALENEALEKVMHGSDPANEPFFTICDAAEREAEAHLALLAKWKRK